ncbi:MAG: L-erythro-3,5-diaminohexanoate dehydrogenase, partial [Cyanobacteria bacterium REEB65]|nr:L-erythro-3,5-diaminohexanoate dehydrogenase [Cyanobacteria bacterium REEB65]
MTAQASTNLAPASAFGIHRVVEPTGVLPYAARRLDSELPLQPGEALIAVERLNIDSASFLQLEGECGGDLDRLGARILEIVADRGKMHNPVTGSGGVLIGTISETAGRTAPALGERVVTLTSLTTTPLKLEHVSTVDPKAHQVWVRGRAILFECAPYAVLDGSLPEALALSVLDVCGAPAQARRLVQPGNSVLVAGAAGRSGLLVSWVAASQGARVIG